MLDTNVIVSGLRSRRGASFEVLSRIGTGVFDVVVSVPLVLEYESALLRDASATGLRSEDIGSILDYICLVGISQPIFYLWRPLLRDPKDDMVAEAAVAADCDAIVTHNVRHFKELAETRAQIWSPASFLAKIRNAHDHA